MYVQGSDEIPFYRDVLFEYHRAAVPQQLDQLEVGLPYSKLLDWNTKTIGIPKFKVEFK